MLVNESFFLVWWLAIDQNLFITSENGRG